MRNVVLVTLDAARRDAFGAYGNERALTPCCDELAASSIVFEKAQSTGPYTQASFPGILTSSHYLDYGKPQGLAAQRVLLSEPLQAEGITTVAFHSNPYLCDYLGWNRGWDVFYDSMEDEVGTSVPYIRGDVINKKVAEWLDVYSRTRAKPFFLWVHYMDVHEPYVPEPTHIERAGLSIDMTEDEMLALFQDVLRKRDVSNPESVRRLQELYYAHVREADGYVEELLSCLDTHGLIDETAVIVTSDHGDEFGEHGGLSHDDKMYSELLDVPLFIYGADDPARYDRLVSTLDIAPTILSLFDLDIVPQFQGTKLMPLDRNRDIEAFSEAIDMRSTRGGDIERDSYCCRRGDMKLIHRRADDAWECYDLSSDKREQNNMYQYGGAMEDLQEMLMRRVRRWET